MVILSSSSVRNYVSSVKVRSLVTIVRERERKLAACPHICVLVSQKKKHSDVCVPE